MPPSPRPRTRSAAARADRAAAAQRRTSRRGRPVHATEQLTARHHRHHRSTGSSRSDHRSSTDPLADLTAQGVSLWLDDLSRQRLQSGNLAVADRHLAHQRGHHQPVDLPGRAGRRRLLPAQLDELAARGAGVDDTVREVTTDDVRDAVRPVHRRLPGHRPRRRPGVASRSTRAWPTTPRPPSTRPTSCTRSSTGPTC